jgi:hypothetical protein
MLTVIRLARCGAGCLVSSDTKQGLYPLADDDTGDYE